MKYISFAFLAILSAWSYPKNNPGDDTICSKTDKHVLTDTIVPNGLINLRPILRTGLTQRTDTLITIKGPSDSISFISLNRDIKRTSLEADDTISPYSTTPINWAIDKNIPVFRIRHPYNVSGRTDINTSLQRDFKIYPYEYGMAIDYNGVVECWVGEWSIHRSLNYTDVEGTGNGWGGVLWVGDDNDGGGVRATARNNVPQGGSLQYGELSVERFDGTPLGNFRFRLPSTEDEFQFVYGSRGSQNVIAKILPTGFIIPKVAPPDLLIAPKAGQLAFDSIQNKFMGFDGVKWITIGEGNPLTGSSEEVSDGVSTIYAIQHSLSSAPGYFNVIPTSEAAAGFSYVTADCNAIYIHYKTPPQAKQILSWNWMLKKVAAPKANL